MGRKRNNGLSEEKRNIIGQLIEMYDIKTAADIQEALKDLLGGTIQSMLEAELDEQAAEREEADPAYHDSRNGYKPKTLRSSMGAIPIQVPQDRNSDFEPQVVPKYKKNISEIEGKIIAMYARGMSVAQVSEQIRDVYGFDVSEGMVTAITNKLLPEIEAWQKRPLSTVYPIVYIDAIVFNMRENSFIIAAPDAFSGLGKFLHVVLGQVLQLHIAPSPATGAIGPVELERTAHTSVPAGGVAHGDILFHAGLGQLLPQNEDFLQIGRAILEQRHDLLFAEAFRRCVMLRQPLFHLLHGIGVFKAGQLLHLLRQLGAGAHIHLNGAFHQLSVDSDTPVVDLLILMVLLPHVLWHGIPAQALLNAHLRFHVPQVIRFEKRPFLRRVLWQIACATAVALGGSAGLAEIADQLLAFAQLLFIQRQRRAHTHQGKGQAQIRRPDHSAAPLCRIKELVVWQTQISGQAHPLEVGIEGPLGDALIRKRCKDFFRDTLAAGQINYLHGAVVYRIAEQQNFKIRCFAVAIHRGFAQIDAGIGFYIKADVFQ